MRSRWIVLLALGFMTVWAVLPGHSPGAEAAAAESTACMAEGRLPVTVLVRGAAATQFAGLDGGTADPYIDTRSGRTVVPMRALFEQLSPGIESVRWYERERTATFWYRGKILAARFPQGTTQTEIAHYDGQPVPMKVFLCRGRAWVSARSVADALGVEIQYHDPGIVVMDANRQEPKNLTVSVCGPWPNSFLAFIGAPTAGTRQAATAAACRILQQ